MHSPIYSSTREQSQLPAPRLHPFFRLLIGVAGCVVAAILATLTVAAATSIVAAMQGVSAQQQTAKFMRENILLVNLFIYPPTLLWLWFCRRFFDRRTFNSLGLRGRGFFSQFFAGILCGFLSCALIFGVLVMSGLARLDGPSLALQSGGWGNAIIALLGWVGVMLCVGFMEEIAFRGYALHNLQAWLGARAAIGIQAVVFALIHLGNLAGQGQSTPDALQASLLAMPNITLIGIFFALCYYKTGSLWFPIAFHAAWNFFLGCVFSFPVSGLPIFRLFDVTLLGSTPLTGGSFGPEASLLLTPILLVLNFVIWRTPDHFQAVQDSQSLQPKASVYETIEETETPEPERGEGNRFKTRMGKPTLELDADTMATLRALNEQTKAGQRATESPFAIAASATSTPAALQNNSAAPQAAGENSSELQPNSPQPNSPQQNPTPEISFTKPLEIAAPITTRIETTSIEAPRDVAAPSTPPMASPGSETTQEKPVEKPARKAAPRW